MAITPGPGYMVDPNNPNGVVPIGSQATINNPNENIIAPRNAPISVPTAPGIPGAAPVVAQTNIGGYANAIPMPAGYNLSNGQVVTIGGQKYTVGNDGTFLIPGGQGLNVQDISAFSSAPKPVSQPVAPTVPNTGIVNTATTSQQAAPLGSAALSTQLAQQAQAAGVPNVPQSLLSPPGANPLTFNGSIIDLLNSVGQDSSKAARAQLAAQYGIQNYTGTAAQNTELGQDFTAAFNKLKATSAPANQVQASQAVQEALQGNFAKTPEQQQQQAVNNNPQGAFFDAHGSLNPATAALFNNINQILSTPATTQTLAQTLAQNTADPNLPAGIPGESISQEQLQLMNIQNVMNGNNDAVRQEIQNAGGTATESQVEALVAARNKTLINQASLIQQSLSLKQDYVNQIMQLTQADEKNAENSVNQKIGLETTLANMETQIQNAATGNIQNIVKQVGYTGLSQLTQSNPQFQSQAEESLGLPSGALSNPQFLEEEDANKKTNTQVVNANGQQLLVDMSTGKVLSDLGSSPAGLSGTSTGGTTFTSTQTNNGAANAGLPIATFRQLPADVQNYYDQLTTAQSTAIHTLIQSANNGTQSATSVQSQIDSSNAAPAVKSYLKSLINPQTQSSGGVLQSVANFFGSLWNSITGS